MLTHKFTHDEFHLDMHVMTAKFAEVIGPLNICKWLAETRGPLRSRNGPPYTPEEILNEYEGGFKDWWGFGSVTLWEMGLEFTFKVNEDGIVVSVE